MTDSFQDLQLTRALQNAIDDLGFEAPTAIQSEAFPLVRSGKNVVGISQTGTGKTIAFMLPILQDMKFSKQIHPRVLVLVPTRELVVQLVEQIELLGSYMSLRVLGVYGGTNMNTQRQLVAQGVDVLVATPGRLYDLALSGSLKLKTIQKLVIDEVDVMLDLGFRFQLTNIFDLLPERRQNLMFSATMTDEIDELINDFFIAPAQITIAMSGTPLDNISQLSYHVPNFYTKVNLLSHLLRDKEEFQKVLVFTSSKKEADKLYEELGKTITKRMGVIHSNRSQNARLRVLDEFESGVQNILIATDVIARGLDLTEISHVINFDCPAFPENYMHRIGRTGRAEQSGTSLLFWRDKDAESKAAIESLMDYSIPERDIPDEVEISNQKLPEEREDGMIRKHHDRNLKKVERGEAFHEKIEKNSKVNEGGKYRRELAKKYKKPRTRGDKRQNNKKKR